MPSPIIYQKDAGLIQGIQGAGSAFAQALAQKNLEQKELQKQEKERERYKLSGGVLNQILSELPQNATPEMYQNALGLAIQRGVPLDMVKQFSDLYKPILQERLKQQGAQNYLGYAFGQQPVQNMFSIPLNQFAGSDQISQMSPQVNQIPQGQPSANQQRLGNFDITKASDEALLRLSGSPYKHHQNLANVEMLRRQKEKDIFYKERDFNTKGADIAQENANNLRSSIRRKEGALQLARSAIETGETGPLSWSNISQRLGIPELMNQAGTELTQAGKEFFFGNMQKVSAKAQNQWLEQRITKLAAEVGDPRISALTKQTMLEGEVELDQAFLNAYDKLAKEDTEKFGYIKKDIEDRAYKMSEPEADKILKKTSYKTRQLYEEEKGFNWLKDNATKKVVKGTYLTPAMAFQMAKKYNGDFSQAIENAKKLGYEIPTEEEAISWR